MILYIGQNETWFLVLDTLFLKEVQTRCYSFVRFVPFCDKSSQGLLIVWAFLKKNITKAIIFELLFSKCGKNINLIL